jgi:hypothetical protein
MTVDPEGGREAVCVLYLYDGGISTPFPVVCVCFVFRNACLSSGDRQYELYCCFSIHDCSDSTNGSDGWKKLHVNQYIYDIIKTQSERHIYIRQ